MKEMNRPWLPASPSPGTGRACASLARAQTPAQSSVPPQEVGGGGEAAQAPPTSCRDCPFAADQRASVTSPRPRSRSACGGYGGGGPVSGRAPHGGQPWRRRERLTLPSRVWVEWPAAHCPRGRRERGAARGFLDLGQKGLNVEVVSTFSRLAAASFFFLAAGSPKAFLTEPFCRQLIRGAGRAISGPGSPAGFSQLRWKWKGRNLFLPMWPG